ncbi:MAG: conjugal transfer protein TraS, partial [Caldimonas sp.]
MSTDGMLEEWGTRLFYGMPAKGKRPGGAGVIFMSAGSVRAQVRVSVRPHAKQVMVKITGGGRGM